MKKEVFNALRWIVNILDKNKIPYKIGGGLAAHIYGSTRPVNDIDISLSGKYFSIIVPLVKEYVIAGPKYYKNEKWDCTTLSLNYNNQEIDITDSDTLLMSNKNNTSWIKNRNIYKKYPNVIFNLNGANVSLMHPRVLIEYKRELDGEHQKYDINFLERYIKDKNL